MKYNRPQIMGILNLTPDSFSDGGAFLSTNQALRQAWEMILNGADILDIGGESSRPGASKISWEEEWDRIKELVQESVKLNALISVDTYKPEVALRALELGVHIINDISGLSNPKMREVISKYKATAIIMHMKGTPEDMQKNPHYEDVVQEIYDFFKERIDLAKKAGIKNVIIDPGIGFGKTLEHNIEILKNIDKFESIGCPLMIGASRKSFLGKITGEEEAKNRDLETHLIAYSLLQNNISILRVHDVHGTKKTIDLYEAMN